MLGVTECQVWRHRLFPRDVGSPFDNPEQVRQYREAAEDGHIRLFLQRVPLGERDRRW